MIVLLVELEVTKYIRDINGRYNNIEVSKRNRDLHTQWITKQNVVSFSNTDRKYKNMFFRRNILLVLEIPSAYIVRFDEKTQFISFFLKLQQKGD